MMNTRQRPCPPIYKVVPLTVAMSLVTACGAAAPVGAAAARILIYIGSQIIIKVGADYLEKVLKINPQSQAPTLQINYTDSSSMTQTVFYQIRSIDSIAVSRVDGEVRISGDGTHS